MDDINILKVKGKDGTIIIKHVDRPTTTDDQGLDFVDAAEYELESKNKAFKSIHATKKKSIEQEARTGDRAKKVASFYASFEGEPKSKVRTKSPDPINLLGTVMKFKSVVP